MSKNFNNLSKAGYPNHSLDYQTDKISALTETLEQSTQPIMEALKASEARYRLIEDNLYDLIATFDPESYEFIYLSPSHFRLFGYEVEEASNSNCFDYIHPDDKDYVKELFDEGIKKG